jgi:hypothetical protein
MVAAYLGVVAKPNRGGKGRERGVTTTFVLLVTTSQTNAVERCGGVQGLGKATTACVAAVQDMEVAGGKGSRELKLKRPVVFFFGSKGFW